MACRALILKPEENTPDPRRMNLHPENVATVRRGHAVCCLSVAGVHGGTVLLVIGPRVWSHHYRAAARGWLCRQGEVTVHLVGTTSQLKMRGMWPCLCQTSAEVILEEREKNKDPSHPDAPKFFLVSKTAHILCMCGTVF